MSHDYVEIPCVDLECQRSLVIQNIYKKAPLPRSAFRGHPPVPYYLDPRLTSTL